MVYSLNDIYYLELFRMVFRADDAASTSASVLA